MWINWARTRVKLNGVTRVRCEPGWSLDEAWSQRLPDFDLWLVWAGQGRMQLRSGTVDLRPGVCLWMRPGGRYLATHDPAQRLGVNAVHFELRGPKPATLPPEVTDVVNLPLFDAVMAHVIALRQSGAADQATAVTLFTGLLMEFERQAAHRQPGRALDRHHQTVVAELVANLRASPQDAPGVAELARRAGYSPDHFARIFRKVTGVGPELFVVQCKIDRAKQLLLESSMSVQQIADSLGYCDVYFLSRQFKQRTGCSPAQYRQGCRVGTSSRSASRGKR